MIYRYNSESTLRSFFFCFLHKERDQEVDHNNYFFSEKTLDLIYKDFFENSDSGEMARFRPKNDVITLDPLEDYFLTFLDERCYKVKETVLIVFLKNLLSVVNNSFWVQS